MLDETLQPDDATQAWDVLSEQVESFISAWDSGPAPPAVGDYLPASPAALRRMALVELIKVDLEYRWRHSERGRSIEEYVVEFPELAAGDGVPCDLIYEEFHVRRQAGDAVETHHYFERFPRQAAELGRLLGLEAPHLTTTLVTGDRAAQIKPGGQIDDFDLLASLGKGAFATVFLARQRSMQRLVALKVSSDQGVEAQTLAQLDHPHIVRVYDQRLLPERRTRLLYMQYVPGGTLHPVVDAVRRTPPEGRSGRLLLDAVDRALDQRGESPPTESSVRKRLGAANWPTVVCWVGARLAAALDYAHRQKVLHRDVKPANVLLAADGSPKLVDFNVSYSSQLEGATPAAYFGGSLAYMSPEQLEACNPNHLRRPDELDGRSDVYSLGVMLWELLTGNRPFDDTLSDSGYQTTLDQMTARRQAGVSPAAIARLPADAPDGLDQVLLKCLAPNPDERFATAGQLARRLELCLQPRAQRLFRPRPGDWRQWIRRRAWLAIVLAGLLPNVAASLMNIAYNRKAIVEGLSPLQREHFFSVQLAVVNVAAYGLGIGVLVAAAWPVLRAVARTRAGRPVTPAETAVARRRALQLGDFVAWVSMAEWLATAIVFPLWLSAAGGHLSAVPSADYAHFLFAALWCGLLAATLSFLSVTFVVVRAAYPMLTPPEAADAEDQVRLTRLGRRINRYFFLAVTVPFLAMIMLAMIKTELQIVFLVLGVVGLVGSALAYLLAHAIHADLEALSSAGVGAGEGLGLGTETVDSFWSSSRR